MKIPNLILASSSEYRQNLLKKLNFEFITDSPNIDEIPLPRESPKQTALRLSEAKANALLDRYPDSLVIGSDQVAVLDGYRLGKPGDRDKTIEQLSAASGKCMTFYTGIAIVNGSTNQVISDFDECNVYFKKLTPEQIERYVDLEQPFNCAGGFKSEGMGIALLNKIEGSDPNALIGLPLIKLIEILERFGVEVL